MNIYAEGKFNDGAFGSDRDFQIYDVHGYGFHKLSPEWRLGRKWKSMRSGALSGLLRVLDQLAGHRGAALPGRDGREHGTGNHRQISPAGAGLCGAGLHRCRRGADLRRFRRKDRRRGGFRYRIARKLGLDAGIDVAYGPSGAVFYLQFGHAWAFNLD